MWKAFKMTNSEAIKPFVAKGYMTYLPLNLIPSTSWIAEIERAGKNK